MKKPYFHRFSAWLLATVLILSLCACGSRGAEASSAPAPAQGRSDNGGDRSNDLGDLGNILDAALEDKAVKDEASDKAE